MKIAQSRITAQGQISVPVEVRKELGAGPGSVLEWEREGENVVVRNVGRYSSEDVRRALFGDKKPRRRTLKQLNEAKARYASQRYARSK